MSRHKYIDLVGRRSSIRRIERAVESFLQSDHFVTVKADFVDTGWSYDVKELKIENTVSW